MLVIDPFGESFGDHADELVRYRLPERLTAVSDAAGVPQILLSRGESGGVLQIRLRAEWPQLGLNERAAPVAESRFRLLTHSPSSENAQSPWHDSLIAGDILVDRSISLSAVEAAIAKRLGVSGGELVDVEVEASVRGFLPVYPWTASAPGVELCNTLRALLGSEPVPWRRVEEAFLSLALDDFVWRAAEPAAIPAPRSSLIALAHHATPHLFTRQADGWVLRDDPPERLRLNLQVPAVGTHSFGLRWSFSRFLDEQPDPSKHIVDVSVPAPLEAAELVVVNDLPLSAQGVSRIEVEVRTGGPTGRVRHTFLPGQPSAARLRFVRETFEDLALEWRAKITVVTSAGVGVVESPTVKCGLSIRIRPDDLGLTPVRISAEPEVFEHAQAIECVVATRRVTLDARAPEAWLVGRNPPPDVEVIAIPKTGEPVSLGRLPLASELNVSPATLGVGETVSVPLRLSSAVPPVAYVAVQVEGGPWRTLDEGASIEWPVRRTSRLSPPRLRYRTRHVAKASNGSTSPMAESAWREAEGAAVAVEI